MLVFGYSDVKNETNCTTITLNHKKNNNVKSLELDNSLFVV